METKITMANPEKSIATQKEITLPDTKEQPAPKRIRKRIKYSRPAPAEWQVDNKAII
jgi:hypothetical protein